MKQFWTALAVGLPPIIALSLVDPDNVLGVYDQWIAALLGLVTTIAGYLSGVLGTQESLIARVDAEHKKWEEEVALNNKLAADLGHANRVNAELESRLNKVSSSEAAGNPSSTSSTATVATTPKGNTEPRKPIRGSGGKFAPKTTN